MLQVLKLDHTYTTGEESACYLIGSLIKNLASQVNLDSLVNFAAFKEYGIPINHRESCIPISNFLGDPAPRPIPNSLVNLAPLFQLLTVLSHA